MRDPILSDALLDAARQCGAMLDAMVVDEWRAIRLALVASALYEALKRERARVRSAETGALLEAAIERCRNAVDHPERTRQELAALVSALLVGERPAARPRFRLIRGGLGEGSRAAPA